MSHWLRSDMPAVSGRVTDSSAVALLQLSLSVRRDQQRGGPVDLQRSARMPTRHRSAPREHCRSGFAEGPGAAFRAGSGEAFAARRARSRERGAATSTGTLTPKECWHLLQLLRDDWSVTRIGCGPDQVKRCVAFPNACTRSRLNSRQRAAHKMIVAASRSGSIRSEAYY
jgi:hypothetical protein